MRHGTAKPAGTVDATAPEGSGRQRRKGARRPRGGRARLAALAAIALTATGLLPERAQACAHCCTPYTYLQFCCAGCLNADFLSLVKEVSQYGDVVADLAEFINQANEFRQQLTNDYIILTTIGQQAPAIASMVTQYAYDQGVTWLAPGTSLDSGTSQFRDLYMLGESSNNMAPVSPTAYATMKQDIQVNAATTMGYVAVALKQSATDLNDLETMAATIPNTKTKREDIQVNSRMREKLVALEQVRTTLVAQYLALRARTYAFRNQTDLSPPAVPGP